MQPARLSPSSLNLFRECARCFWLDKVKGIRRPRGIFPSLPSGMDLAIKTYFDGFRGNGRMPPELASTAFDGAALFPDQAKLDRWRNWRTGLEFQDGLGAALFGAIDDLLVKSGRYLPFDYKTKGSPTTEADATKYYQNQMDCYALLLDANGMPPHGCAILLYYSPETVGQDGGIHFNVQPIQVAVDPARARHTLAAAVTLLKGPVPPKGDHCEYCGWFEQMKRG